MQNNGFENCIKSGLIKKANTKQSEITQSIKQAEFFLEEAYDQLDSDKKEAALLMLYNALFHATRAMLFKDGYKEKSHYCLQQYLLQKSKEEIRFTLDDANLFDQLRVKRQEIQYEFTKKYLNENIEELYNQTEEFIEKAKSYIEKRINYEPTGPQSK